jgi:hypothetical protein
MLIGEFRSSDLGELFKRERRLRESYEVYCRQHSKNINFKYCTLANALFQLEIFINKNRDNGDNGEIKSS